MTADTTKRIFALVCAAGVAGAAPAAEQPTAAPSVAELRQEVTPRRTVAQTNSPAGGTVTRYEGGHHTVFANLSAAGGLATLCTDSAHEAHAFLAAPAAKKERATATWEPNR